MRIDSTARIAVAVLLAVVCLSLLSIKTVAQRSTGAIVGTVLDSTGAAVPGAKVTVTNMETNVKRTFETDATGSYSFPSLIPGTYRVTAEKASFKIASLSGLVLAVDQTQRADLVMAVGGHNEVVDVTASALRIETDTADVSSTLNAKAMADLPLVNRNFMEALTLAAGVTQSWGSSTDYIQGWTNPAPGGADSSVTGVNVGGGRVSATTFTIEGVSSTNTSYGLSAISPSVDAIQELKVETSYYSAESKGASLVNLSMKGGTNKFHGSGFEFWRDARLQPTDPRTIHPITGEPYKPPYSYHNYGGTVGGPIRIPGVFNGKDKSFFFFSYEGERFRYTSLPRVHWIDPAWRTGDFSKYCTDPTTTATCTASLITIYDPATTHLDPVTGAYIRDPFLNNQIPANRIAPQSRYYIDNFIPNFSGGSILIPTTSSTDVVNWTLRLDHNFSEKDKISGRYSQQSTNDISPGYMPLTGNHLDAPGRNFALVHTHLFSPRVVNELRLGYTRSIVVYTILTAFGSHDYSKEAGFQNTSSDPMDYGIPKLQFRGGLAFMGNSGSTEIDTINTYQYNEVLTWSHGRQNWKFGADFRRDLNKVHTNGSTNQPTFQFYNGYTTATTTTSASNITAGHSFADFLLGLPSTARISSVSTKYHPRNWQTAFFAQNDWAVARGLTLNLGLRYEYAAWTKDLEGGGFELDTSFPGGRVLSPNKDWLSKFATLPSFIASGSRMGIIKPDRTNFAPRFGFAWKPFSSDKTVLRGGFGIFYVAGAEWYEWQRIAHPNLQISPVLSASNRVTPTLDFRNLFPPPTNLTLGAPTLWNAQAFLADSKHPYAEEWSLGVQRMLANNLRLEVRYQGSVGRRLPIYLLFNQASLPDPNNYTPVQSRVPYSNFYAQSSVYCMCINSNYNALQAELERQFAKGLSFKLAYTWSKNLDYGSELQAAGATYQIPQNSHDLKAEYGPSTFDVPQRVVLSYTYELPFGKGRHFLGASAGKLGQIIGGWQTTGVLQFQSGRPFTIYEAWDNSDTTNGAYGDRERAQQIGNPYPAGFKQSPLGWFNTSAFTDPAEFTFGNARRNSLRGMAFARWDASVFKDFKLREGVTLQFRGTLKNATKHFGNNAVPDPYVWDAPYFGQIVTDKADTWTASERQLGLKIIF